MKTTINILKKADEIVNQRSEEKNRKYGEFSESMENASKVASLFCGKEIDVNTMFACMYGLKISRIGHSMKEFDNLPDDPDSMLDLVAYLGAHQNYKNTSIVKNIDKCPKFQLYKDVWKKGKELTVRGLKTKEITNYTFTLAPYNRFFNFKGRNFNLKYLKEETKWYLKGDRYDLSICDKASMWKTLIAEDKGINSNYGQYINPNIPRIISTLGLDSFSRRAVISIGNNDNYNSVSNDYCCGQYLSFHIRENKLCINVSFRSSDLIYGITNDIPTVSFYQEIIFIILRDTYYPKLEMGNLHFFTNSLHIYDRHYKMTKNILSNATEFNVKCPKIKNQEEAYKLLRGEFDEQYEFSKWLNT